MGSNSNRRWPSTAVALVAALCGLMTQATAAPANPPSARRVATSAPAERLDSHRVARSEPSAAHPGRGKGINQTSPIVAPASSASAHRGGTPIPINNAGFEEDFAPPGCFAIFTPTDWTLYDPSGIVGGNDAVGVIDPTGTTNFPAGAPEGLNVGLIFLGGQMGEGPVGLSQALAETLQPDTTYTLTVEVGNIASGIGPPPCDVAGFFDLDNFPGYQVQLLAGGVVVAQDDNTLHGLIPEGEFRLSTVMLTTGQSHPQLGQTLAVRLINLNQIETFEDPGIEVDFDDVQLTAAPAAPIPAASHWGLLILSIAVCIAGTVVLQREAGMSF